MTIPCYLPPFRASRACVLAAVALCAPLSSAAPVASADMAKTCAYVDARIHEAEGLSTKSARPLPSRVLGTDAASGAIRTDYHDRGRRILVIKARDGHAFVRAYSLSPPAVAAQRRADVDTRFGMHTQAGQTPVQLGCDAYHLAIHFKHDRVSRIAITAAFVD